MEKEQSTIKERGFGLAILLNGWQETRRLTLDWIDTLSLEQLNQELPRPGLNSFVKHIYEMGEVQKIYANALIGEKPVPLATKIIGLSESSRKKKVPKGPSIRRISRSLIGRSPTPNRRSVNIPPGI